MMALVQLEDGFSVRLRREGELLMARCTGLLIGPAQLRAAQDRVIQFLARRDARAVVVSLANVVPAFGREGWEELVKWPPHQIVRHPMAIVVPPMYEGDLRHYCLLMAQRGLVRGPFIGEPAAVAWASRCLEHWPARPAAERRSQSRPPVRIAHTPGPGPLAVGSPSSAQS